MENDSYFSQTQRCNAVKCNLILINCGMYLNQFEREREIERERQRERERERDCACMN